MSKTWTRMFTRKLSILTIVAATLICPNLSQSVTSSSSSSYGMENMSGRVVLTKQAQFQGFLGPGNIRKNSIYQSDPYSFRSYGHPVVEIFKGIPYASPPIDGLRYESPAPFPFNSTEVYTANVIKTPCPRFGNETMARESYNPSSSTSSRDSIRGIKRIKNMEDCLYLDIYAPMNTRKDSGHGLPVLVFANSKPDDDPASPFDGSSMAAIGNIIVISFRYRVGVLGFLQPGYTDEVRSNFGLWDQLLALQWIRENIKDFGGDETNVCLMASDLDASLAGVLAFSRMSQAYGGLFQRLILLNSSPFSPTSLHQRPLITTIHLARALNCPLQERDGELLACLRRKPVTQLLAAAQTIGVEDLEYPFVPGLDGTIVQHDLASLGFGNSVTLSTPIQEILGRFDLLCGLGEGAVLPNSGRVMWQNIELDRFVTAAIKLVLKLEPGAKPSGNLKQDVMRAIRQEYGETPLMRELISDFLVINPMTQLLDAHSETGKNTFFYVSKDYDPLHKGKHNELSYVFTNQIYQWKYVDLGQPNMDLYPFEVFISLIANFVRTGDPNVANPGERASNHGKSSWPKYKRTQGRYLSFGREADLRSKYRRSQTEFWSQIFPAMLKPFLKNLNEHGNYPSDLNNNGVPPFFGSGGGGSYYPNITHIYPTGIQPNNPPTTSTMTQSTVILIGVMLLLLNFLCFMGLFYQRERLKKAELQLRKRFLQNEEQEENLHHQQNQCRAAQLAAAEQTTELDSQESGPYLVRNPTHPAALRPFSNYPYRNVIPMETMSETETDNGFGPDFLGPNYDPRTKVNRWMYQQNHRNSFDRPTTPPPSSMSMSMPPPGPSMEPMHIDIRSLQRRPDSSHLLTMVPEFAPILPYQTPFQPQFEGSDTIPYADSRATSPSVANFSNVRTPPPFCPAAASAPPHAPTASAPFNNNLSNVNFNNSQRRNFYGQPAPLGSPMSTADESKMAATPNRSSIVIPVRNSIIIRDLDDSVESSAPKMVPLKTGTLTRSVAVGSNHDTMSVTSDGNNGYDNGSSAAGGQTNIKSSEIVPYNAVTAAAVRQGHGQGHGQGHVVQKVTFADGL